MAETPIHHISDTALWIAAYRAQETERTDAAFKDHLARRLAGARGFEMVAITSNTDMMAFAMVARTVGLDRLVAMAIAKGVDTVINLGAGLDTRPYRMTLPSTLRWIEVDFPHLIQYKEAILVKEEPVCQLQRIAADLSNEAERQKLFESLGAQTKSAVVITEGVVGYLTNDQAASLSASIHAIPSFTFWMMDYSQGAFRRSRMRKRLNKQLVHTPLQFTEKYPLQFFAQQGWRVEEDLHMLDEARRIGRRLKPGFPASLFIKLFPKKMYEMANNSYGYVMLRR